MIHIKKILCPVDFFPPSDKALRYAADLARDYGARMHLLHVVTPILPVTQEYPMATVGVTQSIEEAAKEHMAKLTEDLKQQGVDVTSQVAIGDVHLLIEQAIDTEQPDVIV